MPSEIVSNKSGYDLNSIFAFVNILICASGAYIYYIKGNNQYVDGYTILLLFIFGAQNLLMLLYEKKKRDPFILLLIAVSEFFYLLRVVTLLYDPWSVSLDAGSYTPDDLNYSLIFIIFSNASIFLGLSMAGGKILYKKENPDENPANPITIIIILLIAIGATFFIGYADNIIGRLAGYITSIFFRLFLILLCTLIYVALHFRKTSRTAIAIIFFSLGIFIVMTTLSGSRSAIFALVYLSLIAFLSVNGRIILSNRLILIASTLVFLSFILFILATHIRGVLGTERGPVSSKELTILKSVDAVGSQDMRLLFRPLFDRVGFLDYATIVIINHEKYSKIINFTYYCKSIITNVLTPGFKVFEVPRVSHAMSYIARGEPLPTREDITAAYQADMPTVYGEYYVLFQGYLALIILFVFSYVFKKLYLSIRSKDTFFFYLYRALILYIFYLWLTSFGIDWLMFDIVGIIITVGLFKRFYKMRRSKLKPVYSFKYLVREAPH